MFVYKLLYKTISMCQSIASPRDGADNNIIMSTFVYIRDRFEHNGAVVRQHFQFPLCDDIGEMLQAECDLEHNV